MKAMIVPRSDSNGFEDTWQHTGGIGIPKNNYETNFWKEKKIKPGLLTTGLLQRVLQQEEYLMSLTLFDGI